MNIYNKIKENLKLTIYGYTDELRDSSGDTTNTSKSQITNVLTPYITSYDSQYINSKKYRFQIPDILKYKILPENCRLFVNAFTLPLLELVPHDIILKLKTNENNYFDNLNNDDSVVLCSYTYNPLSSSIINTPLTPSDVTTSTTTSSTDPTTNITTNITTTTRVITLSGSTQTITTVQTSKSDFTQNLEITENVITYPLKVSGYANDWYYSFGDMTSINFITFLKDTKCDVMVVGGGGDGGIGSKAGGGGSGEICIKYDYIFTPGTYNIVVGNKNQLSSIGSLFSAKPGGIGGSYFTLQNVIKDQIIPANSFYRININNFTSIAAGTYRIDFNTDPGVIKVQSLSPLTDIQDRSFPVVNTPLAWYKFDISSNLTLDNQGTYNLTAYNTPTFNTSDYTKGSGSVVFNGSTYFEVANTGQFSPDDFSICCWCKIVQAASYRTIAACRNAISNKFGWIIYVSDNNLQFWTGSGGTGYSGIDINLYNNFAASSPTWRHLVITMNKSSSTAIIYINGVSYTSLSRTYANNTAYNMRIGASTNEGGASFFISNGSKIDDFRFYNRVLTAAEVANIYHGTIDIYTLPSLNGGGFGSLNPEPVIINNNATVSATLIDSSAKYIEYTYNAGTNSITFPSDVQCDVFMIGGGGGGGYNHGGGGGAGAYCLMPFTFLANTTYNISVGTGGAGGTNTIIGNNGGDTIIRKASDNSIVLQVKGGGYGGTNISTLVGNGGCGGGGKGWDNNNVVTIRQYAGGLSSNSGTNGVGFAGGSSYISYPTSLNGAGGGGCGGVGGDATASNGGNGGNAIQINLKGSNEIYGGGGGSCAYNNSAVYANYGKGGGIGTTYVGGYITAGPTFINPVANSGSGGYGGNVGGANGGNGANGKVIIKCSTVNTIQTGGNGIIQYKYPPVALTSSSTIVSNQTYGNGTYIITSSTELAGENAYKAFDNIYTGQTGWTVSLNGAYYLGNYTGALTTVISGVSYPGEWLQIQFPYSIILNKYQLFTWTGDFTRGPKTFHLAGSNDSTAWFLVNSQTNITGWNSSGKEFTFTNTTPYTYYRVVVPQNNGGGRLSILEWLLYEYSTSPFYPTSTNPTGTTSYYGAGYDGTINGGQGGENPSHSYNIYGSALNLGYAGIGSTSSSFVPNVKSTYGSGGDGNGGLGTQGLVVFRFEDIDTTTISVSSVTVLQPTTTIYTPQAVSNVKNEYFINSFKIPRNFFSKGFIEMELMTLLNTNITFEKSQLDRLMIDLIVYEEINETTEDNLLAPQVDLKTLSYNIKSDLY